MNGIVGTMEAEDRPLPTDWLRTSSPVSVSEAVWTGRGAGLAATAVLGARGTLTVAADARIDGREELLTALGVPAGEHAAVGTAEAIARAFERWGERCVEHLCGDYAFAVWDACERRLFCARDHIGARPLYYWQDGAHLVLASDLRRLLAHPGVPAVVDEAEIARCLLTLTPAYHDNAHTFFRDVRKLPFGHWLSWTPGRAPRLERYWRPEELEEIRDGSPAEWADALRALTRRAVADRLQGAGTVGTHLSGGLDSSAVAVLAARERRAQGRSAPVAFSWSPPPGLAGLAGEHGRIAAVARQENLSPVFTPSRGGHLLARSETDVATRPLTAMNLEWAVQAEATARGVRLILSGWGGDEGVSFNGRGLGAGYWQARDWRAFVAWLSPGARCRHPRSLLTMPRLVWSAVRPELPDWLVGRRRSLRDRIGRSLISDALVRRIGPTMRPLAEVPDEVPGVRAMQCRLLAYGHLTARIEAWAVHGAGLGIEYAYPLLDRRVLEFVYRLPGRVHWQEGRGRALFRRAMAPVLPPGLPWEPIKAEPALRASLRGEDERPSCPWWPEERGVPSHPWVDLEAWRMSRARMGQWPFGALRAWECLNIWSRWI